MNSLKDMLARMREQIQWREHTSVLLWKRLYMTAWVNPVRSPWSSPVNTDIQEKMPPILSTKGVCAS